MKLSTLKIILNMFNSASSDQTMPHLCGVSLVPKKDGIVRVQATDGYMMTFCEIKDESLNAYLGEERNFVLSSDLSPLIKAFCKSFGRIDEYGLDIKHGSVTSPAGISIPLKSDSSMRYPHTDSLIPKDRTPKYKEGESVVFRIDPDLIARAYKAMGLKKGGVKITVISKLDPIIVEKEVDGVFFTSVIMPMRL